MLFSVSLVVVVECFFPFFSIKKEAVENLSIQDSMSPNRTALFLVSVIDKLLNRGLPVVWLALTSVKYHGNL